MTKRKLDDWDDNTPDLTELDFKKDSQGRYVVPEDYRPPSNFRGRVIFEKSRIEYGYPGVMRKRKKTVAEGDD